LNFIFSGKSKDNTSDESASLKKKIVGFKDCTQATIASLTHGKLDEVYFYVFLMKYIFI
jgi:hypothetical protein